MALTLYDSFVSPSQLWFYVTLDALIHFIEQYSNFCARILTVALHQQRMYHLNVIDHIVGGPGASASPHLSKAIDRVTHINKLLSCGEAFHQMYCRLSGTSVGGHRGILYSSVRNNRLLWLSFSRKKHDAALSVATRQRCNYLQQVVEWTTRCATVSITRLSEAIT